MEDLSLASHLRVRWGATDAAGIVYYPNYFIWFDQSTHDLLRHSGYPVTRIMAEGRSLPVIEVHGRFLRPLAYDQELVIRSHIGEVRTRAIRVEHRVFRNDELVCTGFEVRMWVRLHDGRVIPEAVPDELRALLLR